ncbi:hypothetical protein CANARDRAFT_55414 [[Candida] arabinofermentans NRRL YB-2248]|uniref:M-phase phosphoprotein 6 n=1 Tax=[Candida] arabinofermentans NRRL YB-2248 TaxID=983967 RepID=A0A1E4T8N6_9ASCO|nr:hypothetical protein CANARDRAFT_55414 [[Candida] arabinofermentans NRRL YB-2248]
MSGNDFSSRVRNMKFMQVADRKLQVKEEEVKSVKKVHDSSEWKLPSSNSLLKKVKSQKHKVVTVGYSQLNTINVENSSNNTDGPTSDMIVGRRTFGVPKPKPEDTIKDLVSDEDGGESNDKEEEDDEDDSYEPTLEPKSKSLVALWTNNKKQKRKSGDSEVPKSKKIKKSK